MFVEEEEEVLDTYKALAGFGCNSDGGFWIIETIGDGVGLDVADESIKQVARSLGCELDEAGDGGSRRVLVTGLVVVPHLERLAAKRTESSGCFCAVVGEVEADKEVVRCSRDSRVVERQVLVEHVDVERTRVRVEVADPLWKARVYADLDGEDDSAAWRCWDMVRGAREVGAVGAHDGRLREPSRRAWIVGIV